MVCEVWMVLPRRDAAECPLPEQVRCHCADRNDSLPPDRLREMLGKAAAKINAECRKSRRRYGWAFRSNFEIVESRLVLEPTGGAGVGEDCRLASVNVSSLPVTTAGCAGAAPFTARL